jgi:hypothetical protein
MSSLAASPHTAAVLRFGSPVTHGARILSGEPPTESLPVVTPFLEELQKLGYTEGRNLAIDWRWAEAREQKLPTLATELVYRNVDVILAISAAAVIAAKYPRLGTKAAVTTSIQNPSRAGNSLAGSLFIEGDRYPLSPRILTLKAIRAKLRPEPVREPLPSRKHYEPPRVAEGAGGRAGWGRWAALDLTEDVSGQLLQ